MSDTVLLKKEGRVAVLTLNRPDALNALNGELMTALTDHVEQLSDDPDIGCIVITGSEKAFAAGADIKEMADKGFMDAFSHDFIKSWQRVSSARKPLIAAVSGYALGGGCELAMMCDFILAGDNAKFGQPEITIGTIPGAGGTQRLTRYVGKAKAMEMCLTGRMMDAAEAERTGLVSRVLPAAELVDEAIKVGERIASMSQPMAMMVKESVNRAFETTLAEGILFERRLFHATFATRDQKEGMAAFVEKRQPDFSNS